MIGTTTSTLPTIQRQYPYSYQEFKSAYDDCAKVTQMLQSRINRIQERKRKLMEIPYTNYMNNEYMMRNYSNQRGLMYGGQYGGYAEPIYYPLEPPLSGEPIALPNIEVGRPSQKSGFAGMGIQNLASIIGLIDDNDFNVDFGKSPINTNLTSDNLYNNFSNFGSKDQVLELKKNMQNVPYAQPVQPAQPSQHPDNGSARSGLPNQSVNQTRRPSKRTSQG